MAEFEPIALDHDGRFLVYEIIGVGGMGIVYRGHDLRLDRQVALKVLRRRALQAEQIEHRLIHEAQTLASIQDRNILVVYDIGRSRNGDLFLAMQYIHGPTLREWQVGRPLIEILPVYLEAGRGLIAAHERSVVHRDFKPDNVLLEGETPPRVYVADFGLAWSPEFDTQIGGGVLGTPEYMAPEQHQRACVTTQSDQYAFCVALWEACIGARPLADRPGPARPPGMPRWLYRQLIIGLSPRPEDRHPSLAMLLERIERVQRRKRRLPTLGVAAGLAVLIGALGYTYGSRPPECSEAAHIDKVWTDARATKLRAHLESYDFDYAAELAEHVIARLAANVELRHQSWRALCEQRERVPNPELLAGRERCLERWRLRTTAQLEALEALESEKFPQAMRLLEPLVAYAELCARMEAPAPLDAGVQQLLEESENASLVLDHAFAQSLARYALELAGHVGRGCTSQGEYSREQGFARLRLGLSLMQAGQAELARPELQAALIHASACADDSLAINAHTSLARLLALELELIDAAWPSLGFVQGRLDGLDEPSESIRRADLLEAEGFAELKSGQLPRAIERFGQALVALGATEDHPLRVAKLYESIGAAAHLLGDFDGARENYARAHHTISTMLATEHPLAQRARRSVQLNEGLLAYATGETERALERLTPLLRAPELDTQVAATTTWLYVEFDGEATPEQFALARELLKNVHAQPALETRTRAEALTVAGQVIASAGDESGVSALRESLTLWMTRFPESENTGRVAVAIAQALYNLGRIDEARAEVRQISEWSSTLPADAEAALTEIEPLLEANHGTN
ncbi:protein kinase [Pseudenhygromyxa sp. WMMC2535]|uniref:protein kinase domain-containing protein n=1 Tax=Pseudenhygromyxa sp. WMMC2535 TaxID=2712867 RepID=UPI001594EF69|nr:protein kinase [Pseudenhygromyxa sp. WMMC2535]